MELIDFLHSFKLSWLQWTAFALAVFVLGIAKAGVKGFGVLIVVILAFVFGEKASTGILLPLLIAADIMAVIYYNRHTKWIYIKKLMPLMIIGVLVGVWMGHVISEEVFKRIMAGIIILSVLIMIYTERQKKAVLPSDSLFSGSVGFLAGFTTMVGNLAGPISNIYFLATRLPKNEFIGTAAWLFFIINVFKLPFHILVWNTISKETLALNSIMLPILALSFFIGVAVVKLISNLNYRRFILVVTALGGLLLLFN